VRQLHVLPLRLIPFVKANITVIAKRDYVAVENHRLAVATSQLPLAGVETFAGAARQCSAGVYAICVLLNSSLTKQQPTRRARQIFDPKFTIPHVPEGYD
jgi:hypothetical protein